MRIEPAPYSLAYYEARARSKPIAELNHAIQDISATMSVMRERDTRDPYMAKLLNEFDAMTVELSRRRRLVK
jgi:nitrogen fixation/metabolism regulation signal transduction histidine kinase